MLFINDTNLIEESPKEVNCRLDNWREPLESKELRMSRGKNRIYRV